MAHQRPAGDLVADALDLSDAEVSEVLNASPFLALLPTEESSNGTTHKYSKYTAPPTVGFRDENDGREYSTDTDELVTEDLKILDWSSSVDKAVADRWRDGGPTAYIRRFTLRHLGEAMSQWERQLIYGTQNNAAGFQGFADQPNLDQLADEQVVDAGGTTLGTGSSVWVVRAGANDVQAVYKGDGVADVGATVVVPATGSTTGEFPSYYTPACSWVCGQYGSIYSIVRIANVTEDAGAEMQDDLLSKAIELFPAGSPPTHIVMNRRSWGQLQRSRTATNPTGAPAPFPDQSFNIPIVLTDSILSTETLLT